ncbi:MAG: PQQ-binding-like beta-propeller repeat protein [Alphaproteobacteria bacterium]|nr:PQQ-binding-like beta-propeller repeat protein [Alphaproteobacteria bacterium]
MNQVSVIKDKKQPARPVFPRLSGRLYIFPAFIPLIEIVPWLLTGLAALAGITQVTFWRRHRKALLGFAGLCCAAALGIVVWQKMHIPDAARGSRPVAPADMSRLEKLQDIIPSSAGPQEAKAFAPLWTVKTPHESLATPVVAGDLLLTGTFKGTEEARLRKDGTLVWTLHKTEPVFANAVVRGNVAYVGEGLHTAVATVMTAFSLPDGKPLWERQFLSHLEAAVTVDAAHHRLWTGSGDESLWCLDTRDGTPRWHRRIGHIDATPLLSDGTLYTTAWPDMKKDVTDIFALDPETGETRWQVAVPGHVMGSAQRSPYKNDVVATTAIGQVGPQKPTDRGWAHAVSAQGKLRWTVELPGLPLPEGSVLPDAGPHHAGLVIYTLKTGRIVALNADDGSIAWQAVQGKEFDAPATLDVKTEKPLLAAISKDGTVTIRDAAEGVEFHRFKLPLGGYAAPVFDGDVLYVTTPYDMTAYGGLHLLLPAAAPETPLENAPEKAEAP